MIVHFKKRIANEDEEEQVCDVTVTHGLSKQEQISRSQNSAGWKRMCATRGHMECLPRTRDAVVIAMVTSDPLPSTGGVQTVVFRLSRTLAEKGHSCVALASGNDEVSSWGPLQIERMNSKSFSVRTFLRDPLLLLREISRRRKFLLRHGVDVVHLHTVGAEGFYMALAASSLGLRIVATVHGFRNFGTMTRFGLWIELLIYRQCVVITACCEADRRGLLNRHPTLGRRTKMIPNAVDLETTDPSPDPIVEGRVVFLGRYTRQKGVDVLLKAWKTVEGKMRDVELILGGTGPDEPALHTLARELGLVKVTWLGALAQEGAMQVLRSASLVCLPSRWEGMPLVALEAMASGRAVVASSVDGLPEVVEDGQTGLLVPPEDPDALADALIRLLNDTTRAFEYGKAGRLRIEKSYTWPTVALQYLSVYTKTTSSR